MFIIGASGEDRVITDFASRIIAQNVPPRAGFEYVSANKGKTGTREEKDEKAKSIATLLGCLARPRRVVDVEEVQKPLLMAPGIFSSRFGRGAVLTQADMRLPSKSVSPQHDTGVFYYAGGDSRKYLRFWRRESEGKAYLDFIISNWNNPAVAYTGASAGAMILGSSVDGFDERLARKGKQPRRSEPYEVKGLGLFRAQIIPHLGTLLGKHVPQWSQRILMRQMVKRYLRKGGRQWASAEEQLANQTIILLRDTAALAVDTCRREASVIGEGAEVYQNGKRRPLIGRALEEYVNFEVPSL